jgi:transposase
MDKKYIVTLTDSERATLRTLISSGKGAARRLTHARVLLKADQGLADQIIGNEVEVSRPTVERIRKRFVEEGLDTALDPRRPDKPRDHKIDGAVEAHLIALACSSPPTGEARWTLRLLATKLVELEYIAEVSHETVRRALKKTSLHRGARSSG